MALGYGLYRWLAESLMRTIRSTNLFRRIDSMASLKKDPTSGRFRIRFRLQGQEFNRSIKTKERREAKAILGRVEETIMLIERGRMTIPDDAELGQFVLSDGKISRRPEAPKLRSIKELFAQYELSLIHI